MEAPKPSIQNLIKNKEKIFELISNKGNKFIITLINKQSSLLIISILNNDLNKRYYENIFSIEKIKENKFFGFYESIDEILSELIPLINKGDVRIIEEIEFIKINFTLPLQKFKNIGFNLYEKQKSDKDKINELYNIVAIQNKEINELKKEQIDLKNEINDLKIRIQTLETQNKEILNKEVQQKLNTFDSEIIKSINDIEFIITRLKKIENMNKKELSLNLLFRATRDGKNGKDFHKNCDEKRNQLIFIKTTKGNIIGGYTEIGYKSSGKYIKDDNTFVFSLFKKKIYNIKKGKYAISDYPKRGPCFYNSNYYIIYIGENMFDDQGNTCDSLDCVYDGIVSDYELNNGEQYFKVNEIEVFQILFS